MSGRAGEDGRGERGAAGRGAAGRGDADGGGAGAGGAGRSGDETPELARLRRRIDRLDERIVALLNERATVAVEAGRAKAAAGRRAIRDAEREREVLLRVTMANDGPIPQAELLALYRRLMAITRGLEASDRARARTSGGGRSGGGARPGRDTRTDGGASHGPQTDA